MTGLAAVAISACLAVSPGADRIVIGDLVPALPEWQALPADTYVGLAPAPGVTRAFHVPELRALAARFRMAEPPDKEICIQRAVAPLRPEVLLDAMRRELHGAEMEILDFSRIPAPEGEVEFRRTGLRASAAGWVWNGAVRYAPNRRFSIWAKVKIADQTTRVVAVHDLLPGRPISENDLQLKTVDALPGAAGFLSALPEAVGKWPRVRIRAGTVIRAAEIEVPKEVQRGDTVAVEVRNGAAHLEVQGLAEASGRVGERIAVRNTSTNKRFLARVEGAGKVSVNP